MYLIERSVMNKLITIDRHILETQSHFPEATGEFTGLLYQIALAAKLISYQVNKAGLTMLLGKSGDINIQGEEVQKLDVFANNTMIQVLDHMGYVCIMASEENTDPIMIPQRYKKGKYVIAFDPLDGSSNIDVNVSIGTIFSIFRRISGPEGSDGRLEDLLQPGKDLVAAGYIIYGSSTMMVYSVGQGVNGFTLDPGIGEFLLTHQNITIPENGPMYSVNETNFRYWPMGVQRFVSMLKSEDNKMKRPYNSRYIGALVADAHRTLLKGGIFMYPENKHRRNGKLRLLYEAIPISYLIENAGGAATDGKQRILDIQPQDIHQRVPLIFGDKKLVEEYRKYYLEDPEIPE